jgi:hypothetical protein
MRGKSNPLWSLSGHYIRHTVSTTVPELLAEPFIDIIVEAGNLFHVDGRSVNGGNLFGTPDTLVARRAD